PNHYHSVAAGIDRGVPIMLQDNELSRSLRGLAAVLAEADSNSDVRGLVAEKSSKKAASRLFISPIRAND
ncbi:MAG: hypothetical protein DMG68_06060, partial [Acidobacteria bacterium]